VKVAPHRPAAAITSTAKKPIFLNFNFSFIFLITENLIPYHQPKSQGDLDALNSPSLLPPAAKNPFEKGFLDLPKLFIRVVLRAVSHLTPQLATRNKLRLILKKLAVD
jgi:hypothetical protein